MKTRHSHSSSTLTRVASTPGIPYDHPNPQYTRPKPTNEPTPGGHLLARQVRRNHRQGAKEVQHPAQPRRHPHQMLLRRRRPRRTAAHCRVREKRRRLRQPRRAFPQTHLRRRRRQRRETRHVHRRSADPPTGPGNAARGDHEGA